MFHTKNSETLLYKFYFSLMSACNSENTPNAKEIVLYYNHNLYIKNA